MTLPADRPSKDALEPLCADKLSLREIGRRFGVGHATVKRWLDFYSLETINILVDGTKPYLCGVCGTEDPEKFSHGRKTRCHTCAIQQRVDELRISRRDRRTMLKYAAVQAKGGCCQKCGYRKNLAALQFHHPDKDVKHENWARLFEKAIASERQAAILAAELECCQLLCGNCHAEEHHPQLTMPITITGSLLQHLSAWVAMFRSFFTRAQE
jgi:hypothetical protein